MNFIEYYKSHSLRQIVDRIDYYYGLGRLEMILSMRWFNPFSTLWMNLRLLPLSKAVRFPIWVYGAPRLRNLSGRIKIAAGVKVRSGMMRVNAGRVAPPSMTGGNSELFLAGTVVLHGSTKICTSSYIAVSKEATLELGENSLICEYVNVGCFNHMIIGDNAWITHRCQVFDSNYHYMADLNSETIPNYTLPVIIGNGCWICHSTTIGPGAKLPAHTIVGSNSLVAKDYTDTIPENSLIAGIPAKLIRSGLRRVDKKEIIADAERHYRSTPNVPYPIPPSVTASDLSNL